MISPIEVSPGYSPGQIKLVRVSKDARKQLVFKLTDDSGKPLDLKAEVPNPPADLPDFSPQAAATGGNVQINLTTPSTALHGTNWDLEGNILDQEEHRGFVEFKLTNHHTCRPGIFEGSINRYVMGDHLVDTWPVLIAIEPPAMALLDAAPSGPLLIPEIRLAIYDIDNQNNGAPFSNLLDDTEFEDIDLVYAMRRVVQLWNETPPPVSQYTPQNFPYRYWWLQGTVAHLLQMSAARYRRNRLAYQAGGIAVDDQSKSSEYEKQANMLLDQFNGWMMREKYRINMGRTWRKGM